MSVAQRFTLSLLMSFWLPPVVSMLSLATYISENWQMSQCPPCYLCLTPSVGLPIRTFHRRHSSSFFSPSAQLPSRLYQWRFWFHYCWGQSFLWSQGEWHTICTHIVLQVKTQKCMEIKFKGLQTNIIKFELSSGGRLAAHTVISGPMPRRPSCCRNAQDWLSLIPNGSFLWVSLCHQCMNEKSDLNVKFFNCS